MPRGTVRVIFTLPYNTDNTELYEGVIPPNATDTELVCAMARFDVEQYPETLEDLNLMTIEFGEWED